MYTFSSTPASSTVTKDCSSTGTCFVHSVKRGLKLNRILFSVSTLFNSTGLTVINFYKRLAIGVDTNYVLLGTLNIPGNAPVGNCYYKDLESVNLYPGQEIYAVVATAASTAGVGDAGYVAEEAPEDAKNIAAMVLSA